ncbi:hypothetical protein FOA52_005674 [Chlamydomonas sp. UWO 241]|nr:hypothetical protein FOA52_005674 [Chlamydomonas sp. UWO 241]
MPSASIPITTLGSLVPAVLGSEAGTSGPCVSIEAQMRRNASSACCVMPATSSTTSCISGRTAHNKARQCSAW